MVNGQQAHFKEQLIVDIVTAIAEAKGVDPGELSLPLNEVVDVDALTAILTSADETVSVTFSYEQWEVEVGGDRSVALTPVVDAE